MSKASCTRYMPVMAKLAAAYMEQADTMQASVQPISESIAQASRDAEQGRAEGAVFDRHHATRQASRAYYRQQAEVGNLAPSHPGGGR
jgi:hypothetical protein